MTAPASAYAPLSIAEEETLVIASGVVDEDQFKRLRWWTKWGSMLYQLAAAVAILVCLIVFPSARDSVRGTLCAQKLHPDTHDPILSCDTHWPVSYSLPVPFFVGFAADAFTMLRSDDHRVMLARQDFYRRWLEYLAVHCVFFLQLSSLSGMAVFSQVVGQTLLFATAHLCLLMPYKGPVRYGAALWVASSALLIEAFSESFSLYATWLKVYIITALVLLALFPVTRLYFQERFGRDAKNVDTYLRFEFFYIFLGLAVRSALTFQIFGALRF